MKKGFTLVELLVVIAIIGLLASIVLVNLQGVRGRGRVAAGKQFSSSLQHALGSEAVGIWRFDEGSGSVARDNSGYGNNGSFTFAPTWQTATQCGLDLGTCLSFDGVDDYISVTVGSTNPELSILGDVTISVWIKPLGSDTNGAQAVVRSGNAGGDLAYSIYYAGNTKRAYFQWWDGAYEQVFGQANSIIPDVWSNVVAVRSGTDLSFYVNGTLTNTETVTAATVDAGELRIGRSGSSDAYNGLMDNISIFDTALTTAQVQQLYAEERASHLVLSE